MLEKPCIQNITACENLGKPCELSDHWKWKKQKHFFKNNTITINILFIFSIITNTMQNKVYLQSNWLKRRPTTLSTTERPPKSPA